MVAIDGVSSYFLVFHKHGAMHFEGAKTPEELAEFVLRQIPSEQYNERWLAFARRIDFTIRHEAENDRLLDILSEREPDKCPKCQHDRDSGEGSIFIRGGVRKIGPFTLNHAIYCAFCDWESEIEELPERSRDR